jgi:hypothetical protein
MSSHKIQFQSGMSIPEFLRHFGTEAQCAEALTRARWPKGYRCPRCDDARHYLVSQGARKLFRCIGCRHQASVTAGTMMEHSNLPLTTWFLAIHLISQAKTGMSALALKRDLGVSYPTAWLLHQKIDRAMADREAARLLEGAVQLDDAHLGGERSGGKAGCGSENKVPFVAALSLDENGGLDTFDIYSPEYDQPQRVEDVVRMFERAGARVIFAGKVRYGDNAAATVVRAVRAMPEA